MVGMPAFAQREVSEEPVIAREMCRLIGPVAVKMAEAIDGITKVVNDDRHHPQRFYSIPSCYQINPSEKYQNVEHVRDQVRSLPTDKAVVRILSDVAS